MTDVRDVHSSKAPLLIAVTLVGMMMLVIGHTVYWWLVIVVVLVGMVTDDKTVSVYRLIPVTV